MSKPTVLMFRIRRLRFTKISRDFGIDCLKSETDSEPFRIASRNSRTMLVWEFCGEVAVGFGPWLGSPRGSRSRSFIRRSSGGAIAARAGSVRPLSRVEGGPVKVLTSKEPSANLLLEDRGARAIGNSCPL